MRGESHFENGIADRNCQSNAPQNRQVRKGRHPRTRQRIPGRRFFFRISSSAGIFCRLLLIDELHFHFVGAAHESWAFTPGDDAGAKSSGVGESQALAVVSIEVFDFEGRAVGLR